MISYRLPSIHSTQHRVALPHVNEIQTDQAENSQSASLLNLPASPFIFFETFITVSVPYFANQTETQGQNGEKKNYKQISVQLSKKWDVHCELSSAQV